MSRRGTVSVTIEAEITATTIEDAQILRNQLADKFGKYAKVDSCENEIYFLYEESSNYYYAPAVYYTSNGDGHPAEYEDELILFDEHEARFEIDCAMDYEIPYEITDFRY